MMNRSRLIILGTASAVALLAATSMSEAAPPTMNLGLLKPQGAWKVGTVNADGLSYCAMVGKFDKQVVLAFARDPGGYGSVAMDFREAFFTPGAEYEVTLKPASGGARKLVGRASSERSVVVQTGQDAALAQALSANGDLGVSLPAIDVSFALRRFSAGYGELESCAGQLAGASLPPTGEEKDPLSAQIDSAAAEETRKSDEKIAGLDQRMQELEQEIVLRRQETAEAHPDRKLLASTSAPSLSAAQPAAETAPAATGAAAQQMEQQQVALSEQARRAEAARQHGIREALARNEKELASIAAARSKTAEDHVTDFSRKDAALKQQIVLADEKREGIMERLEAARAVEKPAAEPVETAEGDKALKVGLVSSQAQIAELNRQREVETEKLTQKLAETQTDYQSRIAALETERDGLKRQLEQALVFRASVAEEKGTGDALRQAQEKLAASESEKKDLAERIAALDKQNKLLEVALADRPQGAGDDGALKARVAELQKQMEEKDAQVAALRSDLQNAAVPADTALAAELDRSRGVIARLTERLRESETMRTVALVDVPAAPAPDRAEITRLENELAALRAERAAETGRAATARAELENARRQIAELQDALSSRPQQVAQAAPPAVTPLTALERAELEDYRRGGHVAPAAPPVAALRSPVPVTVAQAPVALAMPAVRVADVEPASAPAPDAYKSNRAEAFLDRVMSYHRPGGEEKNPADMRGPDISARETRSVQDIAPAAGTPEPLARPVSLRSPVLMPQAEAAAAYTPPAPEPVSLETILSGASLRGLSFADAGAAPGEVVRQWTADGLNGLFEQEPVRGRFDGAVQAYLDRYRADCPQDLSVTVSPARNFAAGTAATAQAVCAAPSNSYVTSFVFVQDGGTFSSILHTGHAGDSAAVGAVSDRIAGIVTSTGGIAAEAPAASRTPAQQQVAFSLGKVPPLSSSSAPSRADFDFETVVVQ